MYSYSNEVKKHNLNCEYYLKDSKTDNTTVAVLGGQDATTPIAIRKAWIAELIPS